MEWDVIASAFCAVTLPVAATDPRIARRIVYSPGAPRVASAAALLAGVVLVLGVTQVVGSALVIGLCAPFIQIGIVQVAFRTFVRIKHREPVDCTLNSASGIVADRVYTFIVVLGSIFLYIAVLLFYARAT